MGRRSRRRSLLARIPHLTGLVTRGTLPRMPMAILIVLDGVGAGFAPDAADFNDFDQPSTLAHVWQAANGIDAPNLQDFGYLAVGGAGPDPVGTNREFDSSFGRLKPLSKGGKDSVTGHWEMMGIVVPTAFPTYPNGFPTDLMQRFEMRIGVGTLGNRPASGTSIIAELGVEHIETGKPIVYTSADSVFQIAAHEGIVPIERLYEMCLIARELCEGGNGVQRVIARPFEGKPGEFTRTDRRKDYPLEPPVNLIDQISAQFGPVFGIGVVPELFGGRGFLNVRRTQNNAEHAVMLQEAMAGSNAFIFANFEDTDMRFGHRNDPIGFAECLKEFDTTLDMVLGQMREDDLLILTSDHGNDPTTPSTDHSREYIPFVQVKRGSGIRTNLGDQDGFAKVGEAVEAHLAVQLMIENRPN